MKIYLKLTIVICLFVAICPSKSYADLMDMITHGQVKKSVLDFSDKKKWEKMRTSNAYEGPMRT